MVSVGFTPVDIFAWALSKVGLHEEAFCSPITCSKDPFVDSISSEHHWVTSTDPCPASPPPWPQSLSTSWASPGRDVSSQPLAWKLSAHFCTSEIRVGKKIKRTSHPSIETFCPGIQHSHVMVPAASPLAICFPPPTMSQPAPVHCMQTDPSPCLLVQEAYLKPLSHAVVTGTRKG